MFRATHRTSRFTASRVSPGWQPVDKIPPAFERRCIRAGRFASPVHAVKYVLHYVMSAIHFATPRLRSALLLGRIALLFPLRRALPARRLAALGARGGIIHGLLGSAGSGARVGAVGSGAGRRVRPARGHDDCDLPPAPVLEDVGDAVRLTAVVRDQNGDAMAGVPVAWTSSDSFVVRLSEFGVVTAEEPGTVRVQAAAAGVTAEAAVVVEPGQHAVLHKIYRVTGGDGWSDNTNWKTEEPLGAWHGVHADVHGSVVTLSLRDNGLTGAIPPEVGSLHLRNLLLSGNRVSGPIPPELGNLQDLEALDLGANKLTGSIPPELGDLPSLEFLNLSDNRLTGSIPPELGNLRNLRILSLESLRLTGSIPSELGNLGNLGGHPSPLQPADGPDPAGTGKPAETRSPVRRGKRTGRSRSGGNREPHAANPACQRQPADRPASARTDRDALIHFHWNDTELCAPADDAFQEWLDSIYHTIEGEDCDSLADLGQSGRAQ